MDRRFVIFIVLSIGILMLSNSLFKPGKGPMVPAAPPATAVTSPVAEKPSSKILPNEFKGAPEHLETLESDKLKMTVSSRGGVIKSLVVKGYNIHGQGNIDLVNDRTGIGYLGLTGMVNGQAVDATAVSWDMKKSGNRLELSCEPLRGLEVIQALRLEDGSYVVRMDLEFINVSSQALKLEDWDVSWGPVYEGKAENANYFQAVVLNAGKISRFKPRKSQQNATLPVEAGWAAIKEHYFGAAFFAEPGIIQSAQVMQNADQSLALKLRLDNHRLDRRGQARAGVNAFFGPLDYQLLARLGKQLNRIIDFGWFNLIGVAMLYILKFLFAVTRNYGLAIILLTVLIRVILWWPTQKSYTSMKKMQTGMNKMQPRLKTLKEIYKDNPQKLNEETMKLYKEYQINPLGGCLPMLLQMPIFFALYATLSNAVELRGAGFVWIWKDLAAKDPLYILPVLMGATTFIQQRMSTPPAATSEAAAQQKMMIYFMPIMLTFFSLLWPSGLLLYWVVSNLMSIGQQIIINRQA